MLWGVKSVVVELEACLFTCCIQVPTVTTTFGSQRNCDNWSNYSVRYTTVSQLLFGLRTFKRNLRLPAILWPWGCMCVWGFSHRRYVMYVCNISGYCLIKTDINVSHGFSQTVVERFSAQTWYLPKYLKVQGPPQTI